MQVAAITLTRKRLYDEVWKISAAGVSKKYDVPYAQLLQQLKKAEIPLPPSGYWTKINFGKPVSIIELSGSFEETVSLYKEFTVTREKKKKEEAKSEIKSANPPRKSELTLPKKKLTSPEKPKPEKVQYIKPTLPNKEPETTSIYGQTYNIYDRETLYEEVWTVPVTDVAKKYKVSDVAIHKTCKALDIPTPPPGYWAKLSAGKYVEKTPLPESKGETKKTGLQTGYVPTTGDEVRNMLNFLSEEVLASVMASAYQISLPDENEKMHPVIAAHRKKIAEWKKDKANQTKSRWGKPNAQPPSGLIGEISDDSVPRACRIIDALIKTLEPLGCGLTDQLGFVVNGEIVRIEFSESQDKIDHILTKEENLQLLQYEEQRKTYSYSYQPQIRKYDYVYNGRLRLRVDRERVFRDSKSNRLEDRLGDILIELYIAAESQRQRRLAREEAERKRQEENNRKEECRKRYNNEIDRTRALVNEAEDYSIACKIRAYISAYQAKHSDDANIDEWVEWATSKADWYDPTVKRSDKLLGRRGHSEDAESKKLEHRRW